MNFGMNNGNLYVNFTTTQGSNPGVVSVNSGNIVAIPDDHSFHHYRFKYDNNTGVANVWLDEQIVYTYTGTAGRPLSWSGAGNVIIGENMDATSRNVAVLSNFTIQNPAIASALPAKLLSFTANENNHTALLQWSMNRESGVAHYIIERSADNLLFAALKTVAVSGTNTSINQYRESDVAPLKGSGYYRLRIVGGDGKFFYSAIVRVNFAGSIATISCFPNPTTDYVSIGIANATEGIYDYSISTPEGRTLKSASATLNSTLQLIKIDLTSKVPSGVLIIRLRNRQANSLETFKIVKN